MIRIRSEHELRPYQCRAASIITRTERTALFIDMGLGKTAIVLTAIRDMLERNPNLRFLVVAPIKVCETVWRQEARIWDHTKHLTFSLLRGNESERAFALHRPANIYLINPELVGWLAKYLRNKWGMFTGGLAIDESSLFKDHRSKRFRAITNYATRLALRDSNGAVVRGSDGKQVNLPPHMFPRTIIMTGTPRPQNMMNLWSQFYILDHGKRLHRRYETFRGRYFHTAGEVADHVQRYEINDGEDARVDYVPTTGAPERIHELIADITVELDAADYGLLPSIIPVPHMVELPAELRTKYDAFERDAIMELNENMVMAVNGGVKTQMCWQMANGALYRHLDDGKRVYDILHEAKLDELDEIIAELDTNVLITYQFRHDLERILKRHPDATVLPRKAEEVVNRWNEGKIRKLLVHPKSGSHGLNIQYGGNHIIHFSMMWSREQFDQVNRRLARPGQQAGEGVFCHMIMTANTTDELMEASLHEKGESQARFRTALRKYQEARKLGMYVHDLPDYTFLDINKEAEESLL